MNDWQFWTGMAVNTVMTVWLYHLHRKSVRMQEEADRRFVFIKSRFNRVLNVHTEHLKFHKVEAAKDEERGFRRVS